MNAERRRVLIVDLAGADDPSLTEAVAGRASESPSEFTLLVPAVAHGLHQLVDPEDHCCAEAQAKLDAVLPVLSNAAGAQVDGLIGAHDPYAAVLDALNTATYDEVIVATRPHRLSRLLHVDLPRRIAALGVPVTVVTQDGGRSHPAVAGQLAPAA